MDWDLGFFGFEKYFVILLDKKICESWIQNIFGFGFHFWFSFLVSEWVWEYSVAHPFEKNVKVEYKDFWTNFGQPAPGGGGTPAPWAGGICLRLGFGFQNGFEKYFVSTLSFWFENILLPTPFEKNVKVDTKIFFGFGFCFGFWNGFEKCYGEIHRSPVPPEEGRSLPPGGGIEECHGYFQWPSSKKIGCKSDANRIQIGYRDFVLGLRIGFENYFLILLDKKIYEIGYKDFLFLFLFWVWEYFITWLWNIYEKFKFRYRPILHFSVRKWALNDKGDFLLLQLK